jgi:hypothetical protein
MNRLLSEPLTHFFALAVLIFAVNEVASSAHKTRIVVDRQTIDYLVRQREDLELRALSEAERADVVDAFIEDEVLYHEAYARGLDRGDGRMRRNLILKMRSLLTGDIPDPTDAQLKTYFEANRARFNRPATLDLEQVFFDDPAAVPTDLLVQLQAGLDPRSVGVESVTLQRVMPRLSRRVIVSTFGPEVARAVTAIQDDAWHGPFESDHGRHFVRVTGRQPEVEVRFEDVARYLRGDWLMEQSRKAIRDEVERLRAEYEIVIEIDS